MGANIINTLCEKLAQQINELTNIKPSLNILTNLPLNRIVKVKAVLEIDKLKHKNITGSDLAN